jgi:hypothetical protein
VPHLKFGRSIVIPRTSFLKWLELESESRQAV